MLPAILCCARGGKIFGSQWPAPQSKSMQKGRAQPEPGVCLDAAALSCAKLNEFRPFRTAGASCHSCWVPSASHSTLVGLGWSQCRLSLPSFPEMSSLLEKNLSFLSRLVLKVTRIGVEHLRLAGEKGRLESGSRGPRNRGMQGTPSSHHSSPSAVLLEPPRVPCYTPS